MSSVLEAPELVEAIEQSAAPDDARLALARIVETHPELCDALREDPTLRDALVAVATASRSLTRAIVADASLLEPLSRREGLEEERGVGHYRSSLRSLLASEDRRPRAVIRWFKRRELLRIAARDMLGLADMPAVGRELAALADACLASALDIVSPPVPLAVVGMGKLGGRELNYASDVDVLFVHAGDEAAAGGAARELLSVMAEPEPEGIVFRTDANLRPEGRSGPLTRSLDSYEAYYERWAGAWEYQALIKARAVAGDEALGRRFLEVAARFTWSETLDADAIREIRAMKARSEEQVRRRGLYDRELKRGPGGIRDVEFSLQLLQLVHGRHDPGIRSPNTLGALDQLARHGYVDPADAALLDAAYRFLRTAEHRLQLHEERQVHALPADASARTRLARVLGYRDRGGESALEQFEADHRRHQAVVRSIHERLFFRPLLEAFAGAGPLTAEVADERLAAFGYRDADRARGALRELTGGFTRQSRLMAQLFPLILAWLSESPDPDLGLLQLRTLAEGPARSAQLATAFRESAGAAERVCRLLGASRVVGRALRRHPDFVSALGDDRALAHERTHGELAQQARLALGWRGDREAHREGIRRFKRRELLRIAARDLLGFAPVEAVGRELSALADAVIDAALRSLEPRVPFAVIGMGRLGGRGMSYASDVDVLFVYDGETHADFEEADRVAVGIIREIGMTTAEGEVFEIDARLRPEGRKGAMARSLDGFREYYERWAETWEFQALTKARFVAGDPVVGHRFVALIDPYVYRDPFDEDWARDIRRMKARIEGERIPPGEDPQFHLKLGRGSLSDVEFTVQLLRLRHGGHHTIVRDVTSLGALDKLVSIGALGEADARVLSDAYRFCERARNCRFLHDGQAADSLPSAAEEAAHLARMLGYVHRPVQSLRDDYRRLTRRARRVMERVFYGKA